MFRFPKLEGRVATALLGGLLFLQLLVLVDTARRNSETFDEPMYLLAARSYWATGDFSFNREHPPLTKLLIGVPLALAGLELPRDYHTDVATQLRFVYELNDDSQLTLFLGRLPMIALGLLLAFYVYRYGCLYGGSGPGLLSLAAFICLPGMTGNTPLAALDLGAAAFAFIALYYLARLRARPSKGRLLVAGVTFGLAQLTKFSSLLLVPVYGWLMLLDAYRQRSLRPLLRLVALFLVGFTTMFLGYGCEMRTVESVKRHPRYGAVTEEARAVDSVFDDPILRDVTSWFGDRPVPMLTYLKGYDYLKQQSGSKGHASYFRGETKKGEGWKDFYLVTLAVKTPVGVLVLLALSLLLWPVLPRPAGGDGPLLLFPLLVLGYFSFAPSQLGIRYVLPALPAIAVMVGRLPTLNAPRLRYWLAYASLIALVALPVALFFLFPERGEATWWTYAAVVVPAGVGILIALGCFTSTRDTALRKHYPRICAFMLVFGAVEVLAQHPHHLMFYNAFAGGPDQGWRILSVGDDWGQGTSELAELQRERGLGQIAYDYYGTGVPEAYGLDYRAFDGAPTSGLVAVHVIQLTRERFKGTGRYEFLDGLEPIARVNAILLFDVP